MIEMRALMSNRQQLLLYSGNLGGFVENQRQRKPQSKSQSKPQPKNQRAKEPKPKKECEGREWEREFNLLINEKKERNDVIMDNDARVPKRRTRTLTISRQYYN